MAGRSEFVSSLHKQLLRVKSITSDSHFAERTNLSGASEQKQRHWRLISADLGVFSPSSFSDLAAEN